MGNDAFPLQYITSFDIMRMYIYAAVSQKSGDLGSSLYRELQAPAFLRVVHNPKGILWNAAQQFMRSLNISISQLGARLVHALPEEDAVSVDTTLTGTERGGCCVC